MTETKQAAKLPQHDPARPRMKARITGIGSAWPHEPDEHGRHWTVTRWIMDEGDFPAMGPDGLSGWSMPELLLLSYISRVVSYDEALRLAEESRRVPCLGPATAVELGGNHAPPETPVTERLTAELWSQWLSNHAEHCRNMISTYPHTGDCYWELPAVLDPADFGKYRASAG